MANQTTTTRKHRPSSKLLQPPRPPPLHHHLPCLSSSPISLSPAPVTRPTTPPSFSSSPPFPPPSSLQHPTPSPSCSNRSGPPGVVVPSPSERLSPLPTLLEDPVRLKSLLRPSSSRCCGNSLRCRRPAARGRMLWSKSGLVECSRRIWALVRQAARRSEGSRRSWWPSGSKERSPSWRDERKVRSALAESPTCSCSPALFYSSLRRCLG